MRPLIPILLATAVLSHPLVVRSDDHTAHATQPQPPQQTDAVKTFERLKKMEGKWRGKSTKGWTDEVTYRVIANGSVVLSESFDAHPGETMVTLYTLDRGALVLTHYCVARVHPVLEATKFSADGDTIEFTFREALNLKRAGQGHMHNKTMQFIDDDHVVSRWSWFQDEKENWMEEIHLERIKG